MRYEECDESLVQVFLEVMEDRFPNIAYLKYKLVYDTKKKVSKGRMVLADVASASEKIKFFTKDDIAVDGYDYILIVNKKAWELASNTDMRRIISHELRHIFIDEKGGTKLVGHEIEDFYMEIKFNQDDPEWSRKLGTLVKDAYEQEKDDKKEVS